MIARRGPGHRARRGCGRAALAPDAGSRQAGGLLRRPVPDHRLRPQQLHQLRPAPHLHRHAVQVALAQPPHPAGLEHRVGGTRRVHRDPAAAEARRRAVVPGHGRRGLPESLLHRPRGIRATSSSWPATTSTRWITRRCCASTRTGADGHAGGDRSADRGRQPLRHRRGGRAPIGSPASWRSRPAAGDARAAAT